MRACDPRRPESSVVLHNIVSSGQSGSVRREKGRLNLAVPVEGVYVRTLESPPIMPAYAVHEDNPAWRNFVYVETGQSVSRCERFQDRFTCGRNDTIDVTPRQRAMEYGRSLSRLKNN